MSYLAVGITFSLSCAPIAHTATLPSSKEYTNSIGMRLVCIEPGSFTMGKDDTPLPMEMAGHDWRVQGDFDEHPAHKVTISNSFYMGVYQVTNAQYEQFDLQHRGLRGKLHFSRMDDEAVVFVNWYDAVRFCEWLSDKEGIPYRLPTEAEWEYACRAGSKNKYKYYFGNDVDLLEEYEWFKENSENKTHPVGLKLPNGFGLYDMLGNVWEWCQDWYDEKYYRRKIFNNPKGPNFGDYRVNRGGSFGTSFSFSRITIRGSVKPNFRSHSLGFRVVMKKENK